jgi:hypothetical protein
VFGEHGREIPGKPLADALSLLVLAFQIDQALHEDA